ncbi:MAG: biotin--[acetyl-CoA-carboxylase] ligase [Myxococcota bacterium]
MEQEGRNTALKLAGMLFRGDTLSGERLAEVLGVSRAAVHKAVEGLRKKGFDIQGSAGSGYRLNAQPDLLVAEVMLPRLPEGCLGHGGWVHLPTTDSTNTRAAELARGGAAHGTVVVAETQTAGRGRRGRAFVSPPGAGLYLSVVLRPPLSPRDGFRLTLCGAHAVVDACEALGIPARLKWPNDVLVRGRKLCGVLTEMSADMERIHQAIVGIGVNVNTQAAEFPPEVAAIATSARVELGHVVDRPAFCASLLTALSAWYARALDDFPALVQRARERSDTLGRRVKVRDGHDEIAGEALDLDDDGALVLRTGKGVTRVVSGDVEPV